MMSPLRRNTTASVSESAAAVWLNSLGISSGLCRKVPTWLLSSMAAARVLIRILLPCSCTYVCATTCDRLIALETFSLNQTASRSGGKARRTRQRQLSGQSDKAEEGCHARVQLRASLSSAALTPELDQLRSDEGAERKQQHEVDIEEDQDGLRIGRERRRAAQRGVGDRAACHGRAGKSDGEPARQVAAPRPRREAPPQGAPRRTGTRPSGGFRSYERFVSHRLSPCSPAGP